MASARPLITTELGTGTSWLNRHGENGLVVPPSDPLALAAAIRELLDDPERRRRMGARGRGRVAKELTADVMVDRVVGVYRRVLEGRSS